VERPANCEKRWKLRSTSRPLLAERPRDAFENVYPMVPAGGAINEMVLGAPQTVEA